MTRNKNLWIIVGGVIFVAALISGFVLMQPSAQDLLVSTLENSKNIKDGHAVVAFDVDSLDKDASGTVEVWAFRNEDGPGGFRMEVLETSESKAQGALIVSDGETLWAHSPSENKVFVGTPEEAKALMEENEFFAEEFGAMPHQFDGNPEDDEGQHPENAEEAVQKLEEYFNIGKSGSETIAGETAQQIKLEPIPEQMPAEYLAVGGLINLWISQENNVPLAFEFTGSSVGEISVTVLEYEVNAGVDESLFTFDAPEGAEVVTFADLEPRSLTLEEAGKSVDFDFLTPTETPPGATLVDILEMRGALVQRYTLPEGGSFTVAQGLGDEDSNQGWSPASEGQPVEVRGSSGQLFEAEDGSQVLVVWTEVGLFYSVAGDLTAEQALTIAESLH